MGKANLGYSFGGLLQINPPPKWGRELLGVPEAPQKGVGLKPYIPLIPRKIEGFRMFFDKAVDMAHALLLEDLVNGNEDGTLLHLTKLMVDGSAKELHRRR